MRRIKKILKKTTLFINSGLIILLHIPFVFAKTTKHFFISDPEDKTPITTSVNNIPSAGFNVATVFDSLKLNVLGLSKDVFELAVKGMEKLKASGMIMTDSIISIADLSQPSSHKRLYVIDLSHYSLLFNTYVAHGHNSGTITAQNFSNNPKSFQSSPGFYITLNTYLGENGYSLKLNGVEQGINNNAYKRAIVMHGADYVNEKLVAQQGYIGRSWGCPAVPKDLNKKIIETIKEGTCLFIYPGHTAYIKQSPVLN